MSEHPVPQAKKPRSVTASVTPVCMLTVIMLTLSACASQIDAGVAKDAGTPGFWWGLWHGFIFPWSFIGSLFSPDIAVYAVPNKGGWYDFGFFLGITVLGGGSFFGSKKRGG